MSLHQGHVETELKLAINIADVPLLKQQAILKQYCEQGPVVKSLFTTYYDSPNKILQHHGFSLRTRCKEGQWVQTIKTGGRIAEGLHQRKEWHCDLSSLQPNYAGPMPTEMQALLLSNNLKQQIQPLFYTQFERTLWILNWKKEVIIELVLDIGKVYTEKAEIPICEVESELLKGSVDELVSFVKDLQNKVPLTKMNESKASRGYALLGSL